METLHIALIGTNTFPIPPRTYGGEVAAYDLARSLDEMGHEVDLYATPLSWTPPHGRLFYMRSSYGSSHPWFWESEQEVYDAHKSEILAADICHDFSHTKRIAENLYNFDRRANVVSTLWGSTWSHPKPPVNVIVWSEAMRQMGLKGWTGYEGSPWAAMFEDKHSGSLKDAHVVHGGVDTDHYAFEPEKEDYFLWFSRFHPSKGFHIAIQLAKQTGIPLVMMGQHPDVAVSPDHKQGALEAIHLAKDVPNIRFQWLYPSDDRQETKLRVLQRAKAILYTIQFQECFGLVAAEALSCGAPVIATRFGSLPEIVSEKTGILCDTMEDLGRAVQDISRIHPEDCAKDARARFDRRVMAKAYIQEYKLAMDGGIWGL